MATTEETTLERADFTLQLLLFVTTVMERALFIILVHSFFLSAVVPGVLSKDKLSESCP